MSKRQERGETVKTPLKSGPAGEDAEQNRFCATDGEDRVTFLQKALLTALLTGNDSAIAFSQLYDVPLLQTFGVPVALVSMYPIMAGPLAMILIPLTGFLTDKGAKHRQKKIVAVVVNSVVFLSGIAFIVSANLLLMSQTELGKDAGAENSSVWGENKTSPTSPDGDAGVFNLPTTAVLGLIGFILFDVGYDCNTASVRSCVLACSPRQHHISLLAQALGMAALGGCITCVLGLFDLSPLLNVSAREGSLPAQTTVVLFVCVTLIVLGTISTVTMSWYNARRLENSVYLPLTNDETLEQYGTFTTGPDGKPLAKDTDHEDTTSFTITGTSNESVKGNNDGGREYSESTTSGECGHGGNVLHKGALAPPSSASVREVSIVESTNHLSPATMLPILASSTGDSHKPQRGRITETVNFAIACLSLYMASSVLYSYNMYVSDFLGKELFGGAPSAPSGSPELEAYEDGVGLASSGLLIMFCSYFIVSVLQDRLLRVVGHKLDFCLSHFLMAAAVLTLTLTKNLACYYVACGVYGAQRSAMLTVPFALANEYSQQQARTTTSGGANVGKAIAIMTCMLPLNYCTIYMVSGPLMALTGYDATPLLVASGFACLAAITFMLHGAF
ncbi:hypothetical protein BaRGS_00006006 [Batillaria attramentaria]|uniref:Uncharacterized protein n=1 Tax=Batillaria attramentaria TaxID=370345 RepID=A0ABD0LUK6_9CAEN